MSKSAITVAIDVYRGVSVQAKGDAATLVAYSAAAAIAAIGAGVGYAAYRLVQDASEARKELGR